MDGFRGLCDDLTPRPDQLSFIVSCVYAILAALYGLGMPDEQTIVAQARAVRVIEYDQWFEVSYLFAIALTKTSIGITILRIAAQRRHRYTVWAMLVLCNTAYAAGCIFLFSSCQPLAARWNPLLGRCPVDFMMVPLAYSLITLGVITDAACALVPISIVRRLQMPRRRKITLMVVLSMGILAALFSGARYPFCQTYPVKYGVLCKLNSCLSLASPFNLAFTTDSGFSSSQIMSVIKMIPPGYRCFP